MDWQAELLVLWVQIKPIITVFLATVLIPFVLRKYLGAWAEELWNNSITRAMRNGALSAPAGSTPENKVHHVVGYTKATMAGTIENLKMNDATLRARAVAVVKEIEQEAKH